MESKARYFLVGVVVSFLSVVTVVFILWASEVGSRRSFDVYTIYFREHSLSGLQVDSMVTMKGIKVGAVSEFQISPTNVEEVRVNIRLREGIPVKRDTKAIIKRNLLTGLATIELSGGRQKSTLLVGVPDGEDYPVIPEGRTELDQIADSIPGLIEDAGGLLQRFKAVVNDKNIERFGLILQNIQGFTAMLEQQSKPVGEIVEDLAGLSSDLKEASSKLRHMSSLTERQIASVSKDLIKTLDQITKTAASLEKDGKALNSVVSRSITRLVLEIANVSEDISNAARAFTATVDQFEDPRTLLVGPSEQALGPGELKR